jgi:hypothetical protein
MMLFGWSTAELFGAALAWASLVMKRRFSGLESFARRRDLVSVGCEDDALHSVGAILPERLHFFHLVEIQLAGAEDAVVGVGRGVVDALIVERLHDQKQIGLNGRVILREDKRDGLVDSVRIGQRLNLRRGSILILMMSAVISALDGGLTAKQTAMQNMSAKRNHIYPFAPE